MLPTEIKEKQVNLFSFSSIARTLEGDSHEVAHAGKLARHTCNTIQKIYQIPNTITHTTINPISFITEFGTAL